MTPPSFHRLVDGYLTSAAGWASTSKRPKRRLPALSSRRGHRLRSRPPKLRLQIALFLPGRGPRGLDQRCPQPGSRVASLEREPWEVDPEHVKRWVVLVDGAETQLDLVEAGAAAYGVDVTVILDIIHVVEYVWKAAHVFHREGSPDAAHWAWTRVQSILEGKSSKVAAAMRRAATVAGLSSDTRKTGRYVRRPPAEARAVSALRPLPRGGLSHRHRRHRRGVPVPGPRPDGVDRRPLAPGGRQRRS